MNKEIKYLLEEIKDNTHDYVGTNGCLYQDLSREELNLLLEYISNLQNQVQKQTEVIDKIQKIINTEIKLMGYAVNDSCLMLIQDILNEVSE